MSENVNQTKIVWKRGDPGKLDEANRDTIEAIKGLVKARDRAGLNAQLKSWLPEDVMDLMVHLPLKHARRVFAWLPADPSDKVLAELRPEYRAVIMEEASIERLGEIMDRMSVEDASETLAALPDEVQEKLTPRLRAAVRHLMNKREFRPDTAGRLMIRRLVALAEECTAGAAIREIRENADVIQILDDVFVVDPDLHLIGRLNAKRLLLSPSETRLGDLMDRKFVAVSADTDQEDVSRLAIKRNLRSVPVVDQAGKLIGQLTLKELRKIIRDEAAEDLMRMSNVPVDAKPTDPIKKIVKGRLPWLLAGLIGATIAALVIGSYEEQLEEAAILAAFIPVVMSLAGNSGLQASAVSVQALASESAWSGAIGWRFAHELAGAVINGATAGAILGALILVGAQVFEIDAPVQLAMATSMSLLTVTTIAALVGAFVPLGLHQIGVDPVAATGVFITTSNDVLGVLVFFMMATQFYFS